MYIYIYLQSPLGVFSQAVWHARLLEELFLSLSDSPSFSYLLHFIMVVSARVQSLRAWIEAGHDVSIAFSSDDDACKLKIKVSGRLTGSVTNGAVRLGLLAALDALETITHQHSVVDRGHTFSSGKFFACFWVNICWVTIAPPKSSAMRSLPIQMPAKLSALMLRSQLQSFVTASPP